MIPRDSGPIKITRIQRLFGLNRIRQSAAEGRRQRQRLRRLSSRLATGLYIPSVNGKWIRFGKSKTSPAGMPCRQSSVRLLAIKGCVFIRSSSAQSCNTAALVLREDQSLLFNYDSSLVSRTLHGVGNEVPLWYAPARRAIYRNIYGPDFRVSEDRQLIEESFVEGALLFELPIEKQISIVSKIAERHQPLAYSSHGERLPSLSQRALGARINGLVGVNAVANVPLPRLWSVPRVLSHGDLWVGNVVVGHRDEGIAIDWEPSRIGLAPYWYDVVTLILGQYRSASLDVVRGFWMGNFDDALATLSRNWGRCSDELIRNRYELVEAWINLNVPQWTAEIDSWIRVVRKSIYLK